MLKTLPAQLRAALRAGDESVGRIFPPAYPDDADKERQYREMVGDELMAEHLGAIDVLERTVDAERLSEEELAAWLGALNDLRLMLGARLGVTEDMYEAPPGPADPRRAPFELFVYLGWLEEQVVAAASAGT